MKNQAAVLYAPHDVRMEERPMPQVGPNDVLVEVKAVVVGMNPGEELSVPMSFIQNREITLTGTFRYANTYADAIALVASSRIDVRSIITGRYPLEAAEQALQATKQDPTNIKSIVCPLRILKGWNAYAGCDH